MREVGAGVFMRDESMPCEQKKRMSMPAMSGQKLAFDTFEEESYRGGTSNPRDSALSKK